MSLEQSTCPCCGGQGLSKQTIRQHLQLLNHTVPDDLDDVLLLWNNDAQSVPSSSCSLDYEMETSLDMNTSPPSPFSHHYDESMPLSHLGPIDVDEHSNGLVNTLITWFSELEIESHLEAEATEDVNDGTVSPIGTRGISDDGSDNSSDEDWMDFYDMDLDEELCETYQMHKYLCYSTLFTCL